MTAVVSLIEMINHLFLLPLELSKLVHVNVILGFLLFHFSLVALVEMSMILVFKLSLHGSSLLLLLSQLHGHLELIGLDLIRI